MNRFGVCTGGMQLKLGLCENNFVTTILSYNSTFPVGTMFGAYVLKKDTSVVSLTMQILLRYKEQVFFSKFLIFCFIYLESFQNLNATKVYVIHFRDHQSAS